MEDCFVPKKQRPFLFTLIAAGLLMLSITASHAQTTVDCSISTNCANAYCNYAANIERGCRCFDGIDNDGDGKIDKADSNCAAYYGLVFVGEGSSCSITPPGTADPFDLVNAPISSAQNTADTQSKVSVGDVDGDGIPDAVITSKWNSEIRVVATRAPQPDGTQAGAVKSDFNLSGNTANQMFSDVPNSGACKPSRLLFEHENLIADIDKNGKAELFGIVSNRAGNPETPPTCFYLVGFKYAPGDLVPLFKAVSVGTDRPGTFGIADMDGDGKAEIYMRDRIYAAETGKLLAQAGGNWDLDVTSAPVAVNISGDSKMELVCGTKIYSIPSLTDRNPASVGTLTLLHDMNATSTDKCYVKLMNDPVEYGEDTHSSCSVADIDKDGNVDVVISGALNSVTGKTAVFYWNVAKNQVNYFLPPDATNPNGWDWGTGRVNIGDANGDGKLDLSFISGNRLWCLKVDQTTGALSSLWASYRTINDSRSGVLTVTIYDFDNDGKPEMVYRDSQILAVIDGVTGGLPTDLEWFANCQSHTYTEGPIIADVNGDGGTDICVACYTADNPIDVIKDGLQQQALGQFRLYYSAANDWLPTRKVWNQPGYFVVNIKDNLQLPFPQLDQNVIFGTGACPNGIPGPQMPMNVFLNQVPFLSATGCPVFPAPDLSYIGDNPDTPGVDSNGDGTYAPAVEVVPPICGNLAIKVRFNIVNDGDLPISGNIPVSFFKADPTLATTTLADRLHTTSINITNLGVDQTLTTAFETFNGTGGTFRLYIVLNNNGATLPINPNGSSTTECRIDNNIYSVNITPDPFTTKIEKVQDNYKCANTGPNTGEVRVRIFKGGVEETDYSQYGFQWYTGPATAPVIINGATNYNLTGLAEGDYTALVRNVVKGCNGVMVDTTIVRTGVDPDVTIVATKQTLCNPPNGKLEATVAGGNTGYDFKWYDVGQNYLGIQGPVAINMVAGNYTLIVSKDGCTKKVDAPPIGAPDIPDAQAQVLQHVVDCLNPNSGSISADAIFNLAIQDPANYTFDWYFHNNATNTRGSILPVGYGSGQTRTGLPVGFYEVEIKDNVTQCKANQFPVVEVKSQPVMPTASISQVQPQTSCDPLQPNGILTASASGGTLVSPNDFTFEWFKGDNTLPANKITTVSGVKGETVNQVSGGGVYYTVKVTTANNCSGTAKFIIAENVKVPVLTLAELTPNTVCDNTKATTPYNGSIRGTVTFDGNTVTLPDPSYTFVWYNGSAVTDPVIVAADPKNPTLAGLKDGNYTATVERTDLFCKSVPKTTTVTKATILPVLSATSTGSNNCDANLTPDGTVTVSVINTGASPGPFTYKWYAGNTVGVGPLTTGANSQNGDQPTAIKVGGPVGAPNAYTVEVLNTTTGCVNNTTQFVADNSVIPVLSTTTTANSICSPVTNFNGTMTVSLTNPVGTYVYPTDFTFTWYDANTNDPAKIIGSPTTTTDLTAKTITLTKRKENPYTVVALNTKTGCKSAPATNNVANAKVFPTLLPSSTGSNNCDPNMTPDGSASVAVSGTAGPHSFQWYTGSGDPAALTPIGGATSATINNVGGPNIPVGSAPHFYTVLVTDTGTGCPNYTTASVADNSVIPALSTSTSPNSICGPATNYNGSMSVSVTNIPAIYTIADYEFIWKNSLGATKQTGPATLLDKQDAGTYTVSGMNTKTGCESTVATDVIGNTKVFPTLTPSSEGSTNCKVDIANGINNNGKAIVAASGTAGPYSYQWYTGSGDPAGLPILAGETNPTLNNVGGPNNPVGSSPRSYTVLVTDTGTGCTSYTTTSVADVSVVPVLSTSTTPNSICSPASNFNGSVTVSLSNAQPLGSFPADFTFTWYQDNTNNPANKITGLAVTTTSTATTITLTKRDVGPYTVEAYNTKTGCASLPASDQVANLKVFPVIQVTSTGSRICTVGPTPDGTATGTVTNMGAGAGLTAGPFTHQWYDGGAVDPAKVHGAAITGNATGITTINNVGGPTSAGAPFTYTVEVTDEGTGCKSNSSGLVADISVKPTLTLAAFENHICDKTLIAAPAPQQNDGHVDITGIDHDGGPYAGTDLTYKWYDVDAVTSALTANATSPTNTTNSLTLLSKGRYAAEVTITSLGCTSDPVIEEVLDDLTFPDITPAVVNNVNCPAGGILANGSASVGSITEAGVGAALTNYTYSWYNGAIVDPGNIRAESSETGPAQIQGPSTFTVQVTNKANGCRNSASMTVTDVSVTPTIAVTLIKNNTNCAGTPNGELLATPANAGAAFAITWSGGGGTAAVATTNVAGDTYLQLGAGGPYTAFVKNTVTGCQSTNDSQNIIDDFTYPAINVTVTDQTSCGVTPNGALAVTPVAGDTYAWFDGAGTGTAHVPSVTTSITQLASDNYTVEATTTATGCKSIQTNFVPENKTNPVITLTNSVQVTTCGMSPNGAATAAITGLSGPARFPSIKYDLFYAYTKKGNTYPTTTAAVDAANDGNNLTDETANPPLAYTGMAPGYLSAYVVDKNTLCKSVVNTVQIIDATMSYTFKINSKTNGGLCIPPDGGGIDVTVERSDNPGSNCGSCTFTWYNGSPANTNINFFDNPPDMTGAGAPLAAPLVNGEDLGNNLANTNPPGVGAGTYTLVVYDTDLAHKDCGNYKTDFVPPSSLPDVSNTLKDITDCVTPNGGIDVTVENGTSTLGYTVRIFKGTDATGTFVDEVAVPANPANLSTTLTLDKGEYYIEARDNDAQNFDCPFGEVVVLEQLVLPPLLSTSIIAPNTSCDPNNSADGQVQITATSDASDTQAKVYQVSAISTPVTGYVTTPPNTIGAAGASGQSEIIPGMKPISYTITVTDANSNCATDATVTVPDVQVVPDDLILTPTPETICSNTMGLSDGKVVATLNGGELTSHFNFTWAKNNDLSGVVFGPTVGDGTVTGGDLLNRANATPPNWPMGATTGQGNGNRIFYAQATKINYGPGATGVGCKTAIVQVVIPDEHVSPDMTLTPAFDSFCLATAANTLLGDGEIAIAADADPSAAGLQGTFDYAWTNANSANGGMISPQLAQSNSFTIPRMGDGSYQVTATNTVNKCNVINNVTIDPAPYVLTITDREVIDQRICNNDGLINIKQIQLTDNSAGSPNSDTDTQGADNLNALYTFKWYNNAALTAGSELKDAAATDISVRTLSNDGDQNGTTAATVDYAGMKAGTYYVIATRNDPTEIGFGCPSLPYRVDVQDIHVNPVPVLTALSNTSCSTAPGEDEGEILIEVTDNTDNFFKPGTGFTYAYTWSGGAAATLPAAGGGNGNKVNGNFGGDVDHYLQLEHSATPYAVNITNNQSGCFVNAFATITKNETPVFVQSVVATDEINCFATGDGSITVTKVTLNDRDNNVQEFVPPVPGPGQGAISDFNFEWRRNGNGYVQTTTGAGGHLLNSTNYINGGGFGVPIGAGTYTVIAVRDNGSPGAGCKSAPFEVKIENKKINPVVTLTPFSNTSCNNVFEGEIKVEVTDATTATPPVGGFTFAYDWTVTSTPAVINGAIAGTHDGDGFGGGENDGSGADNDGDHPTLLNDGPYTLKVTNATTQCSATKSTVILENATPVFIQAVTVLDQVLCSPDGSITVDKVTVNDRDGNSTDFTSTLPAAGTNMLTDFQFEWTRVEDTNNFTGISNGALVPAGATINATTYTQMVGFSATPAFGAGTYTVTARRKAGTPGANCPSAPYTVVIQDKKVYPVATLTPFANTSCSNNVAEFEGAIKVKVTDASPKSTNPDLYFYDWTASATPSVLPVGLMAGTHDGDESGLDGDSDNPTGLGEGGYAILVRNTQTACEAKASTIILKNSTPVITQLVTPKNQVLCFNDGSLEVKEVRVIELDGTVKNSALPPADPNYLDLADFDFEWYRTTPTNLIATGDGNLGAVSGGTILDQPFYNAIGFDTYYVVTRRITGAPGKNCPSAPYKVDILNKQVSPSVSLTPLANTSCDPNFFEGEIRVKVTDATPAAPPLGGFRFDYQWTASATTSFPVGTTSANNDGDGFGGLPAENDGLGPDSDGDHIRGLKENDPANPAQAFYTVKVTNTTTGCPSIGSTQIFKNSTPVFTQLVVPTEQVICKPDGSLVVQEVKVIDRDGNEQSNLAGDFPLSDFVFTYDRVINGVTTNVLTESPDAFLNTTNYNTPALPPGIGFGTYYVTAIRKSGFPGKDCPSAPYKVDIDDQRLFPKVDFTSIANSSCSMAKPNGSVTAKASEQNGANTDPYTFTWALNGGALAPTSTQTDNSPSSVIGNALHGTYVVTATNTNTGCPVDASFNLILDQTRSTPNIIEVLTVDPLDCKPTARAEVTKITLGSTTNSTLYPPNVPPNNEVTGAALLNFNYNWYEGGVAASDQIPKSGPPYLTSPCVGPTCPTPTVGLVPGIYYVRVQDPTTDCQSGPKEVVIDDDLVVYPQVVITQTERQASCIAGMGTAELQAAADGFDDTNTNYTFTWFGNLDTTPPSFQGGSTASNLTAGNYSVLVLNTVTACTATQLYIVPDDAPKFMPELSLSTQPRVNCLVNDGALLAREIGWNPRSGYPFQPNYTTEIYTGANADVTQPGTPMPKLTGVPGVNLNWHVANLDVGPYTVKITDNNTGCVTIGQESVADGRTPPVVVIMQDNPLTNCYIQLPNGQLSATADDGRVGGYTFDWYRGDAVTGAVLQQNNKLIGETAGTYTVRVTNDVTGCFADGAGEILDRTMKPHVPTAKVEQNRTHCLYPDGWVSASVEGVTFNYSFDWYDGATKDSSPDFNGINYTGRDIGPYTVTAMDVTTGCYSDPVTVAVADEKLYPELKFTTTPSFCEDVPTELNQGNGMIEMQLVPTYALSDSVVWTKTDDNGFAATGSYVTGLYPGFYHAEVTTVKGCTVSGDAEVKTEILAYNLVTRNNDQKNDLFVIDCISRFKNNNVKIFNRSGVLVYEANGYNNSDVVFQGLGEKGVYTTGNELPVGTYFYIIDKGDGSKPKTGYLELVK